MSNPYEEEADRFVNAMRKMRQEDPKLGESPITRELYIAGLKRRFPDEAHFRACLDARRDGLPEPEEPKRAPDGSYLH